MFVTGIYFVWFKFNNKKEFYQTNFYCILNAKEFWNELRFKPDSFNFREVIIVFILVEHLHFERENKIILFNN